MNDLTGYQFIFLFFGVVCAAYTVPFVAVAVARIIRAGNRHLDR